MGELLAAGKSQGDQFNTVSRSAHSTFQHACAWHRPALLQALSQMRPAGALC